MDSIAINKTVPVRTGFWKRRRFGRGWIIWFGNVFLRLSHSRIVMFSDVRQWQDWEYEAYQRLYGGGCERAGCDGLLIQSFPGESLRRHLAAGMVTTAVMVAAA